MLPFWTIQAKHIGFQSPDLIKKDPFFQIRVITDAIPSDAEELLISVRRLYLRDVTLEEKIINQLAAEETELLNLVSSFGADGTINEQIGEIRKRLRIWKDGNFLNFPLSGKN